jgi:NAD(P)-dependent dehydrogenase (short-subunit alcohol dehydrogenase family)
MTDVTDRIVAVTGATDGIGRAMVHRLAAAGATTIVHGRSAQRVDDTIAEIRAAQPAATLFGYVADFASLAAVRAFAETLATDFPRIDVLINNAGIGSGGRGGAREISADGYELRFAVNFLAPFLLTGLTLPLARESSAARIVNVASIGQAPLDFEDVMLEHGYDGGRAYSQSKLALITFTFALAERLRSAGIENVTANVLHPSSLMPTKMVFESFGYTLSTLEAGVEATLRLAVAPALAGVSGRYYDVLREDRAQSQAYDEGARERLWSLAERLCGFAYLSSKTASTVVPPVQGPAPLGAVTQSMANSDTPV